MGEVPARPRPANLEVSLVVRDLEVMSRFYGEAVGLPHQYDFRATGALMRRYACGDGAVFKLMAFDDTPQVSAPPGGLSGATGYRHVIFVVDDLESTVRRCEDAGATVVRPIQQFGEDGPTIAILHDPEGNSFELILRDW
jgi:glyoxylase I family protein